MSSATPVVRAASTVLIHTPGMVRYGSKPAREIAAKPAKLEELYRRLRSPREAQSYLPNLVFVGARGADALRETPRPWFRRSEEPREEAFGEMVDEARFLALLALADPFKHVCLLDRFWGDLAATPAEAMIRGDFPASEPPLADAATLRARIESGGGLPLFAGASPDPVGWIADGHPEDASLSASVLLENLCGKVSAALAVNGLFTGDGRLGKSEVDLVLGCSEEAVGDRYQRGGGNLAKAIAELAGCEKASGFDIKDFCAAPIPAIVTAAALVQAGVAQNVVVAGGSSLPKLGMKFLYHLDKQMPVLEDVQAAVAVWIGRDDGHSPVVNLDSVGRHPVSAGASLDQQLRNLVLEPLERLGLEPSAIDKFVTELHNPEVTIPANGGDVAERNYRMLGAVLAKAGKIARSEIAPFVEQKGLPGYAPTQGHIASALCYVPHALRGLTRGSLRRCLLFARASLFLGQMTQLSDGMSVLLERHP
ncbi:MAG TPA: glycine/sarcosine/betaine reductase complex component C subunit beta [candidate division Zixibacteria bacterium]|nr:glycine/sarcosine/betaine reductase complex component C subunit beta [candidate division Zixibacteria bacterium]